PSPQSGRAESTADRVHSRAVAAKTQPKVHHGEPALPLAPLVIDNTRQPQMSDMTALLNDLSYIPSNNEHNEPTQGDIGETSNEPTQATRNEFEELYASATEELYPGCDYVTRLDFMEKFTYFKVKGVETIDVASGQKFSMRAMVLWTINDFPARSSLSGWSGQGYKACPTCNKDTPSIRVLSKIAYIGHRRFLKKPHKWRSSHECNGQTDNRDPPKEFGRDEILAQLDRLPTRLTGLKSHDCHIMMQHLLPYGLQNYLPDKIAKPIIELCSLFKQICSATLMEDDMLKAQIKVVDILCDLELIYLPALFNIMIHLVIYLSLEALEGGPIRPRWMFPFERYMKKLKSLFPNKDMKEEFPGLGRRSINVTYTMTKTQRLAQPAKALEGGPIRPRWTFPFERYMKKLKGYVQNKPKPEGSIAEGYVAEEAMTFSSHYFWDVTTEFNRLDRNVDPPPPTCQFQIRQRQLDSDKDPEVSTTNELFALACGPTWTPISINSYVVDGVRYVVHNRDERRITQNSGICSPGPDGEMYYDQLQEILEFKYLLFKFVLFRVKWFDTHNKGRKVKRLVLRNNMTQIDTRAKSFKDDQYILVTQVKQVLYLEDKAKLYWRVVEHVNHKKFSDGGVIMVENDPDIIHFDNSSDLPLSTSLNDL
nr:hypothetical protein [Tanacetum cinerariifolium]